MNNWRCGKCDQAKLINNGEIIPEHHHNCSNRHYFTPQEENNRFCNKCDEYLTDSAHFRTGEK